MPWTKQSVTGHQVFEFVNWAFDSVMTTKMTQMLEAAVCCESSHSRTENSQLI